MSCTHVLYDDGRDVADVRGCYPIQVCGWSPVTADTYSVFGLTVESEVPLPQLDPREPRPRGEPDVTVSRADVTVPRTDWGDDDHHYVDSNTFYVSYPVGDTVVRNGSEIIVDPAVGAPLEVVSRLVVGPLFNYLLHQRGYLVVHASTVQIGDAAVAFVGESGDGKSTTATAFLSEDYPVLSDDVAAIRTDDGSPTVQPGYPAMKLDPEAIQELDPGLADGPVETIEAPRRFYRMEAEWSPTSVPLARVYLLEDGPEPAVLSLPGGRQCMALIENTYTRGSFGLSEAATTNFERCTRVADAVPVKRLRRPRQFDGLRDVVDAVIDDLNADE